jgi:hypothetical protein
LRYRNDAIFWVLARSPKLASSYLRHGMIQPVASAE